MSKQKFLRVKNVEKYQHYKDRTGPWIKLYHSILDDPAFLALDEIQQCRYLKLLLIAHRTGNIILDDAEYLQKMMRLSVIPDITPLKDSGFLLESSHKKSSHSLASLQHDFPRSTLVSSDLPKESEESKNKKEELKTRASTLLDFLNVKAGKHFIGQNSDGSPTESVKFIIARLADGATDAECRAIIVRQCRKWKGDEKMDAYLRPATLFNKTKFEQYRGEVPHEARECAAS